MKLFNTCILVLMTALSAMGQTKPPFASLDTLPKVDLPLRVSGAFQEGEYLKFVIHYGIIDAGEAELRIHKSPKDFQGRDAYHIVGTGKSVGAFNWFFKVRDRYETYLDVDGVFPWEFVRDIQEGGYKKKQNYKFFQDKSAVATNKGDTFKIPDFSQDMLSSFYYARSLDFENIYKGKVFTIPTFVDSEVFPLKIKYLGREEIELRNGTYRCMKFVPIIQEGRIFEEEDDMMVWITDDKNRIPVLVKASVLVGSIKMELVDYDNLANPIARLD